MNHFTDLSENQLKPPLGVVKDAALSEAIKFVNGESDGRAHRHLSCRGRVTFPNHKSSSEHRQFAKLRRPYLAPAAEHV
jgi:hypothetical protein